MRSSASIALCAGLLTGAAFTASGQTQAPARQEPQATFRTGINVVRVDVVVTDNDGRPIADLQAGDFEIREAGRPQTIDTFQYVPLDGGRTPRPEGPPLGIGTPEIEAAEASRDDVRVFALFLDMFHVSDDWSVVVREHLTRFVQSLGPSDMLGVMDPSMSIGAMRLTRDRLAVLREIQSFDGRRDDLEGPPDIEFSERYRIPRPVPPARTAASMRALRDLITRLGDLKEGRKAILLVSQGFSGVLRREMTELSELANRHHVAIYPVDPQIRPAEMQWQLNNQVGTLLRLAEDTGGREIVDQAKTTADYRERRRFNQPPRSNLAAALKQVADDASGYYLLSYNSSQATDDKFHEIDVRVRRRGAKVFHRQGYWATGEDAVERAAREKPIATPTLVESAAAAVPADLSPFIRTWIGMGRGDNGLTRVTFVWEPLARRPGSTRDAENAARVVVTATGAGGVEYFSGAELPVVFDAPASQVSLRLSVESARGSVLETDVRTVAVADYSSPRIQIGTPLVFRARTALEMQRLRAEDAPVPSASREFSRAEQLLVRIPVYGPDARPPVAAQLQNRAGRVLAEFTAAPGSSPARPEVLVPLAGLPIGEYALNITAGPAAAASEIVVFRIVN